MWFFLFSVLFLCHVTVRGVTVRKLTPAVDHSECPTWDTRNNILYYVNIHKGEIYRYEYLTKNLQYITLDGTVAPVVQSKFNANLLIIGLNRSVVAVNWDGVTSPSETRVLANLAPDFPTSRTNDGKADKQGRFWIGTMGYEDSTGALTPNQGLLYEITCSDLADPDVKIAPVNISNGMAWNGANDKVFYIDTPSNQVVSYDYDDATGDISNKAVVFDLTQYNLNNPDAQIAGGPDGMTIDIDDNLWVALYGGHGVIKIDSRSGALLQYVKLPARDVTSVMFGNPDLSSLFVTTSRVSLTEEQKAEQPDAGAVFELLGLNTTGVPVFEVELLTSIDDTTCGGTRRKQHRKHPRGRHPRGRHPSSN